MHPAFSVIFLTTLLGLGQGLFLALYTGQVYALMQLLPTQDGRGFFGLGSALALALLMAGLAASFLHLGHPERAWRAAAQWRSSWLSREVILLPLFMLLVALYGGSHYLGWNPVLLRLGDTLPINLSAVLGALGTIACFALFLATGMIYACLRFLQEWASPLTVVNFLLLGSASGFTLAAAFAAHAAPPLQAFYAAWAIILTGLGLLTRSAALLRNARLKQRSNLQSAVGVRHPQIRQLAQGAIAGSFNTREFFHGRSARLLGTLKWAFLVLAFGVPALLLLASLRVDGPALAAAAALVQYLGLIVERWVFFAQARHPQNLYYQVA